MELLFRVLHGFKKIKIQRHLFLYMDLYSGSIGIYVLKIGYNLVIK